MLKIIKILEIQTKVLYTTFNVDNRQTRYNEFEQFINTIKTKETLDIENII